VCVCVYVCVCVCVFPPGVFFYYVPFLSAESFGDSRRLTSTEMVSRPKYEREEQSDKNKHTHTTIASSSAQHEAIKSSDGEHGWK
jgi:hypothetical protein